MSEGPESGRASEHVISRTFIRTCKPFKRDGIPMPATSNRSLVESLGRASIGDLSEGG